MEKNNHKIGFFFKWCFDRIVALTGLIVLFLPLLVIGILIKIDSRGPMFFMQKRIGKEGKPFRICKFRTMIHQSEGDTVTTADDPRITRMGHWLRHNLLEELRLLEAIGDYDLVYEGFHDMLPLRVRGKLPKDREKMCQRLKEGIAALDANPEDNVIAYCC